MAVLDIRSFGGIAPSVEPTELGPDRAQTAENLDLRYGDFRPVKGPGSSVASVTSGSKVIHRTPGGTWLHSTNEADFVNGLLNDTTEDRVYVTGRSAYPEAWEDGTYRRLGVRAPTAAPTAVLSEVDEYTPIEQQTSIRQWVEDIKASILDNYTVVTLGNAMPTTGSLGAVWLAHGAVSPMPTTLDTQIVYAVPISGGVAVNASDQYLLHPSLNGAQITYSGSDYWAVPITWKTYGYDIDEAALATELKTFLAPPDNTDQLIPDDVADQMAARIGALSDPALDPLAIMLNRVNAAQSDVYAFLTRVYEDPNRVYAVAEVINRLAIACRAVDNYYINFNATLDPVIDQYAYLVPAAVERVLTTRTYFYTYVTDWGEESAPSPTSELVEVDQNDSVDITVVAPPAVSGYGDTTLWRLYRSATTNEGAAFEFVVEQAIGTLTYNDTKLQEELGPDVCQTLTWTEPRSDMVNLCGGANGIMAGSVGKIACFCEPYAPYAWPREYELALEHNITRIVAVGQSFIFFTEGAPVLVSGADSAQMSDRKLDRPQSIASKRSAVQVPGGVIFASPDGVCLADTAGVQVLTLAAYSKEDWAALTPSASFAAFSEGVYYLWLTTASKLLTLDFARTAMTLSTASGASAAYTDLETDTLYTVVSGSVLPMFAGSAQTGVYESGVFSYHNQRSFAWARVDGDFTSGILTVYADGSTVATLTMAANTPQRMPPTRGRKWHVRWSDAERATRILLASSTGELVVNG